MMKASGKRAYLDFHGGRCVNCDMILVVAFLIIMSKQNNQYSRGPFAQRRLRSVRCF